MKTKLLYLLIAFFCLHTMHVYAQTEMNNASNPCITAEQYHLIEQRIHENAESFGLTNPSQRSTASVLLNWPLQAAAGFNDCSFYYVAAYVDHDAATTTFTDYNCGTNTYDGHRGTDIATGPFPFYKMDSSEVEVIAAAAGTIIDKHDGEYDRNCVGVGSGLTANYIVIQHSDGSYAFYWHMKKNSLTPKIIGQTVTSGEYLGVVGSSGSSSGPHLHFEVWAGSTVSTLVDPFADTCNLFNASTWWTVQKPYTEPAPIKASVHTTDISFPACGITETTNESTSYTIPFQGAGLNPGYAKFYVFVRNSSSGTQLSMSILNPNTTVYNSWNYNISSANKLSYYGFSKLLPTVSGTYTFQATYNGITCSQPFEIINPTGITEVNTSEITIHSYPNPFYTTVTINWSHSISNGELNLFNEFGQIIKTLKKISGKTITLNRNNLPAGIYFVRLTQNDHVIATEKLAITD